MNSLYLDPSAWDLVLDSSGNIAVASNPYALAQNAASAIRTFLGEVYYNTTIGVPYMNGMLGVKPNFAFIKAQLVAAAESVAEVASAVVYITSFSHRNIAGQVQITSTSGQTAAVNFNQQLSNVSVF